MTALTVIDGSAVAQESMERRRAMQRHPAVRAHSHHLQVVDDSYIREQRLYREGGDKDDVFFFRANTKLPTGEGIGLGFDPHPVDHRPSVIAWPHTQSDSSVSQVSSGVSEDSFLSVTTDTQSASDTPHPMDMLERLGKGLIMLLVIVLFGLGGMAIGKAFAPDYAGPTQTYIVQPQDSLWNIAARTGSEKPVDDVVSQIMAMNDLSSSRIVEGQTLIIPTHY